MLFHFWSMSEDFRVGILLTGSSIRVCLVVLNQGCCDLMVILPWIKVMYCSSLWLILHIRRGINISHLSIPGIVAHGRCYISHCFLFLFCFAFFNCLSCSACILQMRNKPNQFLIQIKVFFFPNLYFCPSFKLILFNRD